MAPGMVEYVPGSALCVVAHPDDTEFMLAGTAAKWAAAGTDVTYAVITKGDKGSADPAMTPSRLTAMREAEQREAARVLGVREVVFLGYEDGYLQPTLQLRRDITRLIRQHRPDVLVTFDPETRFFGGFYPNHPDHRAAGDATVDAMFPSARDRLTFPELLADGLEPHNVKQLWLGSTNNPNHWVDISDVLERKVEALRAHPSQFGEEVVGFVRELARLSASGQPFEYAEAYRRIVMDEGFAGVVEEASAEVR